MKTLQECIDKIIEALQETKTVLKSMENPIVSQSVGNDELDLLKTSLMTDQWPEAINPYLLVDLTSESDKLDRGRGIIELMIENDISGLKFLDFGCGDGYVTYQASQQKAEIAVGYDRSASSNWDKKSNNLIYTTEWDEVVSKGPYDIILLFDVIDHLVGDDPVSVLTKLKGILNPSGKIYMRCHPYTSKHAMHQFYDLNKAYIHLVFTPAELRQISPTLMQSKNIEPCLKIKYPIKTYKEYIEISGLNVEFLRETSDTVETFFQTPLIANRIMKNTGYDQFPSFQLGLSFVDIVATHKS